MIEQEYTVIAVHGEGDRDTVNSLQSHRDHVEKLRMIQNGVQLEEMEKPDEPPDILIVLRDDAHDKRIEHPVFTWDEVEKWKEMIGWDQEKRHWKTGAKVKVSFSV